MSLIEHTFDGKVDKVQIAIDRIKAYDPLTIGLMDTPYYVAYSGGKDSDALRILFELAGVKYDLVHNHTTVDAPETVRYIRSIPNIQISMPEMSMWELIVKKGMPPTQRIRYCCAEQKERYGQDRFVATGVRWAESAKRRKNGGVVEVRTSNIKNKLILNSDNSENRRIFENCQQKGKRMLNPIIDWTDKEVWEFLNHYGCKSNPLYECGYTRIGCLGCPMARKGRLRDFKRYPKYRDNYIRAFDRMLVKCKEQGKERHIWKTGKDVFDWWMRDANLDRQLEGQVEMEM